MKVNILGTEWSIKSVSERTTFMKQTEDCYGECDVTSKTIYVYKFDEINSTFNNPLDMNKQMIRHEVIHAFLMESGLDSNANGCENWAKNEEMVDWIAIQFPKIVKVFEKVGCL